ncbi:ISL3 family transposase [Litchfieldia alkalitelluris]|uniref:ISL3 family transposase n=1 Tax=Litchfieldia alkalitelluris TaxID=304268 RepID=UPI000B433BD7|nr:ISL3 family transposase [Litchfieldia alkalitelluris]
MNKDFEQEYSVFQAALKIEDPWYVTGYELDQEEEKLHIYLDYKRNAQFICPHCGSSDTSIYDRLPEERTWRHMNFWQYETHLHAEMPRVKCGLCSKIRTVVVDWSRPRSSFTWFFEAEVMQLMKEMPVAAVSRKVKEHDTRLWRVFHYYVNRHMDEIDLTNVKRIAIDETSSKRGHNYVTLFVDVDTKRVIFATEGKDASVIKTFKELLESKGAQAESIKECCCDMSPAFIKGIEETFPNAEITFDKFHVMKMVNEAVDQVRRQEQREEPLLKKTRYLWLKNEKNLNDTQKDNLLKLKDGHLKTAKAYRLKTTLQTMWTASPAFAGWYFDEWYQWAIRSRLEPMVRIAKSLKKHEGGILRYFVSKITNGLLEGINSLVQASKRKARGYRSVSNFIAMIYATANKFELEVQPHG